MAWLWAANKPLPEKMLNQMYNDIKLKFAFQKSLQMESIFIGDNKRQNAW